MICDWVMDGMPAHAFAAAIRVVSPKALIVALSALAADQVQNQAGTETLDAILEKPVSPSAPLLQRLTLPVMVNDLCEADQAQFVLDVIHQNIAEGKLKNKEMISERALGKIVRYYGADLRGYGLFRRIPEKPSMLEFRKATVTRYVGAY